MQSAEVCSLRHGCTHDHIQNADPVCGIGETAFVHAQEFIPERWTTRPELVKHSKAFAPFSSGPFGCIGRPLAILNLQTTIVQLLQRFDIELAPGKEATTLEERTSERFVLAPGSSKMTFRERAQHKS